MRPEVNIKVPSVFASIVKPARYKVYYGGRGSSKSHTVARYLISRSLQAKKRILCAREFQNSIAESVHCLLSDLISDLKLTPFFQIKNTSILAQTGSEFFFKGLAHNIEAIKSTEGIDIAWIEEAERVSSRSWEVLIPTIRNEDSEILVTFNPQFETDPTYQRFILNPPPDAIVQQVNWGDNPYFPEVLKREMEHCRSVDYEKYLHIWEGHTRTFSDACVFKGKFVVEEFPIGDEIFRYGADFGFAKDPSAIVEMFIRERNLYISNESFGYGIELKDLPAMYFKVLRNSRSKIFADSSRPETIAFLQRPENGHFNIEGAEKWPGSVEDGIEFVRSFDKIVIHPKCKNTIYEFGAYSYKIDKQTDGILPIVVDANNHGIDSIRYGLSPFIRRKTTIFDLNVV